MTFEGLVPEDFEEFRSVKFWDGFFQKRNRKAFEWYGEWRQLQPLVWGACARPNKQIVMLGCGNSDLSAQMYDAGCKYITNIDFSKVCIKEMMMKNLRQRSQMKWVVMDMTQLTFTDGSFHIAFDKGGLDALMGEDTEAAGTSGSKLLSEVQRVLDPSDGHYFCVTLGQTHVLRKLLSSFGLGWSILIDRVPPSPDMAQSPLQPLLVTATRVHTTRPEPSQQQQQQSVEVDGQIDNVDSSDDDEQSSGDVADREASSAVPAVQMSFGPEAGLVNSDQLADVIKVVEQENRLRASGGRAQPAKQSVPEVHRATAQFDHVQPGRRIVMSLPQPGASTNPPGVPTDSKEGPAHSARFTAAVVDVDAAVAKQAVRECAVFIVPQGREHEWLFASAEGQGQVAQGCSAKRVIVVSLNRGHTFGSLKAVQGELSPLVMDLAPIASRQLEAAIPFMTTQEGIGSRTVLEEAESALTGGISVEDVKMQSKDAADTLLRRMVFTNNRNLVQSEAVLCSSSHSAQSRIGSSATAASLRSTDAAVLGSGPAGKKGKVKGGAPKHKATSESDGQSAACNGAQQLVVDHSQLACDYHKGIVAGLSLIQPHLSSLAQAAPSLTESSDARQHREQQSQPPEPSEQQPQQQSRGQDPAKSPDRQSCEYRRSRPQAMVVGLGGGGLPVFLNKHCCMDVQSVELDPVVVDLARRHFGFADSATLQATVGDGLVAVAELAHRLSSDSPAKAQTSERDGSGEADQQESQPAGSEDRNRSSSDAESRQSGRLDVLVVDAGSGDASVAMSCPPAPFLESEFLQHAKQVLTPQGMLVINCVSRVAEPYKAAVKALQAVFSEVYELDVDEDVNKVLFGLLQPVQLQAGPTASRSSSHAHRKSKAGKGGHVTKKVCIDGSAEGVKLLTPRLQRLVQNTAMQQVSDFNNMLQNLSLTTQPA